MKDINICEIRSQLSDLLYIQKGINNRICNEIDELMRGRGRTNSEIKESIIYILDERL